MATYGFQDNADYTVVHIEQDKDSTSYPYTIVVQVNAPTMFNARLGTIYEQDRIEINLEPGFYWDISETTSPDNSYEPSGPFATLADCVADYSLETKPSQRNL